MTRLEIDLSDALDEFHPDDRVVVWAPHHREGSRGQVVNTRKRRIPLVQGKATVEMEPGPLMVQIQCQGIADTQPKEVEVPNQESVTLWDLLKKIFEYTPPVISETREAADRAEAGAELSEDAAAVSVAAAIGIEGTLEERFAELQTAYDVAVTEGGFTGTADEWLESLVGPEGNEGQPGPEGPYGGTAVTDPQVASWVTDPDTETAGILNRSFRQGISVREHGAVGDGLSDDTAAIQQALNAAPAGTSVLVPAGTYSVSDVEIPAGVTLSGSGQSTLHVRSGAEPTVITLAERSELTNVRIEGNSVGQADARQTLVSITGPDCLVSGVTIHDAYDRSFIIQPGANHTRLVRCTVAQSGKRMNCNAVEVQASYVTVTDCHVYDHGNGHAFRIGTFRTGTTEETPVEFVTLSGCVVERSEHNAYTLEMDAAFVTFDGCTARHAPQAVKGDSAHHITVTDCVFEDIWLATAFNLLDIPNCIVSGVRLKDAGNGITVGENSTVTGCSIENIGLDIDAPLWGVFSRSGVVSNCLITNVNGQGIQMNGPGTISGNRLTDCGNDGVHYIIQSYSTGTAGVSITGNIIRNPKNSSHPTGTAIVLWTNKGTVQGNVLDGVIPRGIRIVNGMEDYIITGNIVGSAATPILEGNGARRVITNNL